MAAAFFLMWDALLLALLWWGLKRFGSSSLRQWQVSWRRRRRVEPREHCSLEGLCLSWCAVAALPYCRLLCVCSDAQLQSKNTGLLHVPSSQPPPPAQWWIMGGAALALAAGEAAWSWDRHRQEVQQEAERAAARLARIRARAQRAAYCAAAATRVWPEPPLQPTVRWPADAPTPAAAAGRGGKAIDPELRTALLADEWEP